MSDKKEWFRKNRAMIGAVAFTVLLVMAVTLGFLQPGRAVIGLLFAWMLALHSRDINDHKVEVLEGFNQALAAGVAYRLGHKADALDAAEAAAMTAGRVVEEMRAAPSPASGTTTAVGVAVATTANVGGKVQG